MKVFQVFAGLLLVVGCGNPKVDDVSPTDGSQTSDQVEEKITIDLLVAEKAKSLSLTADATAFSISLEGCASGYTSTATEVSTGLQVYKFDQNCLAKLTTFTVGGIVYVPTAATPFSTWLAGDTATFEDQSDPTNLINVTVVSQLDNPISGTEPVTYAYSQVSQGADENIADSVVGDSHVLSVGGLEAPSFTIAGVTFNGITATGGGQFVFTLECTANITGAAATTACLESNFTDLKYKLVADTYGSTLTYADAQSIFASGPISIDTATDVVAIGAGGTVNGGFVTKSDASILTGPDQMHLNPNMILVVEVAGTSYTYYNIDVTTLTQN